jgi:hypothetical protein
VIFSQFFSKEELKMKKFVTALVALTAALFLMTGSFAEESHEVNAQITFTTDETVDSIAAPEIPIGSLSAEVFGFDAGQTYAVYSAPDVKSLRGAGGKSKVSTNDWVQVFGREGDWLLVQYDVEDKYYRIGYITAKAIPTGMTVPELNLGNETAVTMDKVNVTDDPLGNQNTLTELPADSHVTKLGVMGDWSYIEGTKDNKLFRGFAPSSILSDEKVVYSIEEALVPHSASETSHSSAEADAPAEERPAGHTKQSPGSVAFVPPVAGLIIAGEVVKDLVGI